MATRALPGETRSHRRHRIVLKHRSIQKSHQQTAGRRSHSDPRGQRDPADATSALGVDRHPVLGLRRVHRSRRLYEGHPRFPPPSAAADARGRRAGAGRHSRRVPQGVRRLLDRLHLARQLPPLPAGQPGCAAHLAVPVPLHAIGELQAPRRKLVRREAREVARPVERRPSHVQTGRRRMSTSRHAGLPRDDRRRSHSPHGSDDPQAAGT